MVECERLDMCILLIYDFKYEKLFGGYCMMKEKFFFLVFFVLWVKGEKIYVND